MEESAGTTTGPKSKIILFHQASTKAGPNRGIYHSRSYNAATHNKYIEGLLHQSLQCFFPFHSQSSKNP
jgi:hypothetical protein